MQANVCILWRDAEVRIHDLERASIAELLDSRFSRLMDITHASLQRLSRYKEVGAPENSGCHVTLQISCLRCLGVCLCRKVATRVRRMYALSMLERVQDAKADPVIRSVAGEQTAIWCACDGHHGQGAAAFVARQCADELLHRLLEDPPCSPSGGGSKAGVMSVPLACCSLPSKCHQSKMNGMWHTCIL